MRLTLKISDDCGLFARTFGLPFLGERLGLGLVIWPCHGFRKEKPQEFKEQLSSYHCML